MKQYSRVLFCLSIIISIIGAPIIIKSSTTSSTTKITLQLPRIYIKNNSSSDTALQSLSLYYGYNKANKLYSVGATGSISLPAGKLISFDNSIEISETSSTPATQGVQSITINGTTLTLSDHLIGFSPDKPIVIDKINNQWEIITQ
jgi:hypothetical protein